MLVCEVGQGYTAEVCNLLRELLKELIDEYLRDKRTIDYLTPPLLTQLDYFRLYDLYAQTEMRGNF